MIRLFIECAIRAALIVAGTALVLYVLRVKVASVKHRVWTVVLLLMLALPAWTAWGPKAELRLLPASVERLASQPIAPPVIPAINAAQQLAAPVQAAQQRRSILTTTEEILLGIYLPGLALLLTRLVIGTIKARRLIHEAVLVDGIITSSACAAPVTVGCFHPAVILPQHWSKWPPRQLDVVLAHEGAHVRRRDPLVQWLALFNRAVFWFHPAAWWLERELSALAEEACDAAVIEQGHDPDDYAEILMSIARDVMDSGSRIHSMAVAMPGPRLPHRITQIIEGQAASRASRTHLACTIVACVMVCTALTIGTLARALQNTNQENGESSNRPKFEVASIKPCKDPRNDLGPNSSPGRLATDCAELQNLIENAYNAFADGHRNPNAEQTHLNGGPSWLHSASYEINAKAEGSPSVAMMLGPMMQALLEDRFQLKIHRQTTEGPVYFLTVARGGTKLHPFTEGSCTLYSTLPRPPLPSGKEYCDNIISAVPLSVEAKGATLDEFSKTLRTVVDRPVIDKTGITGRFDIRVEFSREGTEPASDPTGPPLIFTALQEQLGLKLESGRGLVDELIADHIERPTSN